MSIIYHMYANKISELIRDAKDKLKPDLFENLLEEIINEVEVAKETISAEKDEAEEDEE